MTGLVVAVLTSLVMAVPVAPPVAPPVAGIADYQLGGAYDPAPGVQVVTRDREEPSADGVYSICYVNAFQTQPGTLRWWKKHHPELLLRDRKGHLVHDPGWPAEVLLDLRTTRRRAAASEVLGGWFDRCARDGYEAVEPDNLDSWTRSGGRLKSRHAVWYARLLVSRAHDAGLAIAQKNTPQLSDRGLGFDFAVAEECEVYRECGGYTSTYGAAVIEVEYTDNGRQAYHRACAARGGTISILLRDRDVVPRGAEGYYYRTC